MRLIRSGLTAWPFVTGLPSGLYSRNSIGFGYTATSTAVGPALSGDQAVFFLDGLQLWQGFWNISTISVLRS